MVSCSQMAVTAIFEAEYGPGMWFRSPTTDEVVTTNVGFPLGSGPCSIIRGRNALMM